VKERLVRLVNNPVLNRVAYGTPGAIAEPIDRAVRREAENQGGHLVDVKLNEKGIQLR